LPQADLNVQWQSNGLAGNALPPIGGVFGTQTPPPYLHGGLGQSYANTWGNKFPTYVVGVTLSQPIGNETARGEVAAAREQQRIGDIQTAGVKQRIEFESRNALQAYQSSLSRLYAARHARETSEEVLASEIRKFHNGVSTTFLVLQRQVELAQARGRELQAQTDLNKAVVELQRASGAILAANNVNLATLGGEAPK
jgi:HAE1 family hydrophobic/amphiphilic exporter-1